MTARHSLDHGVQADPGPTRARLPDRLESIRPPWARRRPRRCAGDSRGSESGRTGLARARLGLAELALTRACHPKIQREVSRCNN